MLLPAILNAGSQPALDELSHTLGVSKNELGTHNIAAILGPFLPRLKTVEEPLATHALQGDCIFSCNFQAPNPTLVSMAVTKEHGIPTAMLFMHTLHAA